MNRFDDLRAALRSLDGVCAFESPTLLSIIAELRRGDVSDQRLRALQRPTRQAMGSSSRPTMAPTAKAGKYTAVVQLRGVAIYNFDWPPYAFSTLNLARVMNQLGADTTVESIILDIDSPGGMVTGTQEAADAVFAAAKRKPVVGLVNPLCASAAYWIASQCTSLIGVPSADVGAIGVFVLHVDQSKMLSDIGIKPTFIYAGEHKVEGNSLEPLSPSAKQFWQSQVDQTYGDFLKAVARGRGTPVATVRANFGGGRVYAAKDALKSGMIDQIQAPDAAVQQIVAGAVPPRSAISPGAEYRARLAELAADPRSMQADEYRRRLAILSE
jgi:signal peptide peptidase SppA